MSDTPTLVRAVDTSAWQHPDGQPIDWGAVKSSGVGAAIHRIGQGLGYVDPWAKIDADATLGLGMPTACYYVAEPATTTVADAVHACLDMLTARDQGCFLDIEPTMIEGLSWADLSQWIRDFMAGLRAVDVVPGFYTDVSMFQSLAGCPWGERLWIAAPSYPPRFAWSIRQLAPASVPGIAVPVDIDQWWFPC